MSLKRILATLPDTAGVYQMYDEDKTLIYVGKAKHLKRRVKSYFLKNAKHSTKVKKMVSCIKDIKYTEVSSELEALILETSYIKQHKPKYNILMRDDKHYLYIKISRNEDYPKVYTVRKVSKDGAYYFGPKTNSQSVYKTLKLLRKLFPYRSCTLGIKDNNGEIEITKKTIAYPCLYYHIKRCIGPCVVSCKPEYDNIISGIVSFLKGDYKDITQKLQQEMLSYAEQKKYEKAASTRDTLQAVERLMEKQVIDQANATVSQDIIGLHLKLNRGFFILMQVREGRLVGEERFEIKSPLDQSGEQDQATEILEQFLLQYYSDAQDTPREIILGHDINTELFQSWFEKEKGHVVKVLRPQRGLKKTLLDTATKNALIFCEKKQLEFEDNTARTKGAVEELATAIGLPTPPKRIECYDISHISGTHTVASMVVFEDGKPATSQYRRFKLRATANKNDDFESMKEVLQRRLGYLEKDTTKKNASFSTTPDLIIIDGGKGQLSHALESVGEAMEHIPFISLAKREEEIFLPGESESIVLPRSSKALYLIQNIRDEAHRFAISYNRNLRAKSIKRSILDEIKGVGPKTKKKLLTQFGDIKGIEAASLEEVAAISGLPTAKAIKEIL